MVHEKFKSSITYGEDGTLFRLAALPSRPPTCRRPSLYSRGAGQDMMDPRAIPMAPWVLAVARGCRRLCISRGARVLFGYMLPLPST